jgi:hypothetical protein
MLVKYSFICLKRNFAHQNKEAYNSLAQEFKWNGHASRTSYFHTQEWCFWLQSNTQKHTTANRNFALV